MRRMSAQSAPAQQEALFEGAEPKASDPKVRRVQSYFKENIPFTTENERIDMLNEYFPGQDIEVWDHVTQAQAEKFLDEANQEPDQLRTKLLDLIGYRSLFPAQDVEEGFIKGKGDKIYDYLRSKGHGVKVTKKDPFYQEYKEGVSGPIKRQIGDREHGRGLDEIAEKFNMSVSELIEALSKVTYSKDRESTYEEMERREIEQKQLEEALEERDKPQYRIDVSGEPSLKNPSSKVQQIYEKLLEKLAGESRDELMKEAWRIWYDWSGYKRDEEVVPFTYGPSQDDSESETNTFFVKTFYEEYPKELGISKKKRETLKNRLGKAMETAHDVFNSTDGHGTWSSAVEHGLSSEELLEPLSWVSTRAQELFARKDITNFSDAYTRAYKEWINQEEYI